jgi:hypothetical protein
MIELKRNLGPIGQVFDPYVSQAQLAPALIVIFPVALLLIVWLPVVQSVLVGMVSLACSFGILVWLAQLAQGEGKRRESALYREWGGKPSVALLRADDQCIDPVTKARYRAFLSQRVPGLAFPSGALERTTPAVAEPACESATAWLLTQTRDTRRFALLFQQNIYYGFRRNLWGLKPIGYVTTLVSALASSALLTNRYHPGHHALQPEWIIATTVVWIFFGWWALRVNSAWVRTGAEAYAKELLAACDILAAPTSENKPRVKKKISA